LSILSVKKYWRLPYISGIAISTILFFAVVPTYDVDTLSLGVYAYNNREVSWDERLSYLEDQNVLFYKESPYATVLVADNYDIKRLIINGKTQCTTMPFDLEGISRLASIGYDVFEHNYGLPQNALNIGLGCGITSKWLSEKTDTTTLEIDPVVAETSRFFYDEIDHKLVIDDGRNWLVRNSEKFDIITTEPSDPFENKGSLYTQEFFILLKDNLSEDGIVSQWIPVFEWTPNDFNIFYKTFHSVFPYVYIYQMDADNVKQLIFIGSKKHLEIPNNELYLLSNSEISEYDSILNTDDRPVIEFSTALNIYSYTTDDADSLVGEIPSYLKEIVKNKTYINFNERIANQVKLFRGADNSGLTIIEVLAATKAVEFSIDGVNTATDFGWYTIKDKTLGDETYTVGFLIQSTEGSKEFIWLYDDENRMIGAVNQNAKEVLDFVNEMN